MTRADRTRILKMARRNEAYHAALFPTAPKTAAAFDRYWRAICAGRKAGFLIETLAGDLVAVCNLADGPRAVSLETYADARFQGQWLVGEGRRMVIDWAFRNGATEVRASSARTNPASNRLSLRAGFTRAGCSWKLIGRPPFLRVEQAWSMTARRWSVLKVEALSQDP